MDSRGCTHDLDFLLTGVIQATANIREENVGLKAENEQLVNSVAELTAEVTVLRKERVALKAAVAALMRQSGALREPIDASCQKTSTFSSLPFEVLRPIFCLATAEPTYQFDPSILPGAHNPWFQVIRSKKALPLICRASYWPGMSVLYSDIVLRRMGQVSALADTLRAPDVGSNLSELVKSIRWDSCVVAASCSDVIREDLELIFSRCTTLRSFSYHPHKNFPLQCLTPNDDEYDGFFNPLWFIMMAPPLSSPPILQAATSNLRFLGMQCVIDDVKLTAIHKLLPTLKALESLSLGQPTSGFECSAELMDLPVVSLPFLTNLSVFADNPLLEQYMCSRWKLPRLAGLTVLQCNGWPKPFLEQFGSRLRYLHLYPTGDLFKRATEYVPLALSSVCPLLEHLTVPWLSPCLLLLDSPTLKHLDLWTHWIRYRMATTYSGNPLPRRSSVLKPASNLPSLRTMRWLLTSDNPTGDFKSHDRHADWPWICHPDLLPEGSDDVLYYRFPQGWVAQTAALIIPQDLCEITYRGRDVGNEAWPAVYQPDELRAILLKEGDEAMGMTEAELDALCASSCGEWTSDEEDEEECICDHSASALSEADQDGSDPDVSEDVEEVEALPDDPQGAVDTVQAEERAQAQEEGPEKLTQAHPRQLEVAAGHVPPDYPVEQLDRPTVLAAFRRSRDREAYSHTNIWDHY